MRTILASLGAFLLVLALAGPAAAAPPVKGPVDLSPVDYPAGAVCDFPVHIDFAGKPKAIDFVRRDGVFIENASGRLIDTVTNVESGASVVRQSSGPGRLVIDARGHYLVQYGGASVFVFFAEDSTGRGLKVLKGGAKVDLDENGFVVAADLPVNTEDLCVTLG